MHVRASTFGNVRTRIILVLACLTYAAILNFDYVYVEAEIYGYMGLVAREVDLSFVLMGYFLAALPCAWMPLRITAPSQIAYWCLYIVIVIPCMFVPFHVLTQPESQIVHLALAIEACFALLGTCYFFPSFTVNTLYVSRLRWDGTLMAALAASAALIAVTHGFDFSFDMSNLYDRRFAARETIVGGSLMSYVVALFQRCLVPYAIARGLANRSWKLLAVGVAASFAAFVLACEKTLLYLPVVMCGAAYALRLFRGAIAIPLVVSLSLFVLVSAAEYRLLDSQYCSAYGVQRILINSSHLTAYYWDYFTTHSPLGMTGSLGRFIGSGGPTISAPYTIGWAYFNNPEVNANANVWASAFAEYGYPGMVVVTLVVGLLLRFIDGTCRDENFLLGCLCTICIALAWSEGAVQTSMLSAGLLPLFVLLTIRERVAGRPPFCPDGGGRGVVSRGSLSLVPSAGTAASGARRRAIAGG